MWSFLGNKIAGFFISIGLKSLLERCKRTPPKEPTVTELKEKTHVLFVDDEDFGTRLQSIRDAGWSVNQITDVTDFNCPAVERANIIFMDYIGVGRALTPTDEGIGLLKEIKRRYPEKFLVFYSGYAGFIPGHEFHNIADAWIAKNSDPYVFIDQIEDAAKKIHG
jgi:ActR/RegA family two-component response regulator